MVVALVVLAVVAQPALATAPQSPFDDSTWTRGTASISQKMYCAWLCLSYTVMTDVVSVRGPEGAFARQPVVGERFYVRTELALLTNPWSAVDTYRTRVILPDGLTPSITAADDVLCAITTTSDVIVRVPGPTECADPVQIGAYWEFPAVSLTEDDANGQVAQFWLPVVASKPLTGEIMMTGTAMANPLGLAVNPVTATVSVAVGAAPASAGGSGGGGATGGGGGGTGADGSAGVGASRAPSRITAAVSSKGEMTVTWTASSLAGVTGYRVQQRTAGRGSWRTVGTAKPTATTFTVRKAKLKRGARYQVRVGALVGRTIAAWSAATSVAVR